MLLRSSGFSPGGEIPVEFTCEGDETSPPLEWTDVPDAARSLALVVDDPDAPDPRRPLRVYVHWILYNLPPGPGMLRGGVPPFELPGGTRFGTTNDGGTEYVGPCPPIGRHRYLFRLHALDTVLPDLGKPRKAELEAAMAGHLLATAELMGTYEKRR